MSGRVLHFGKYEGSEIDRVVTIDPEYILWAVDNVKGHGISQKHVAEARVTLDQTDDYEESCTGLADWALGFDHD